MTTSISDLHIKANNPAESIAYPGPRKVAGDAELRLVNALLEKSQGIDRADYMVEVDSQFWRGRNDRNAVDGTWYRLRRMADEAPTMDSLPTPLPGPIQSLLMSKALRRGGLVHIAGGPGCGKTTTGSATVISRLIQFGGVAYAVEDPPELPLNGWHGSGYCTQTWVAGDSAADWVESMRGALRSQPTGTNLMMYVGEVRDAETARAMIRAASNGFLVVGTGFGSDLISGIDTFFQLIGREHSAALAAVLRVLLYQKLEEERFSVQALASESPSSTVANIIRSGNIANLSTEIMYQRNLLQQNRLLIPEGAG